MGRKRILVPGALYRITCRTNHREPALAAGGAKDLFVATLEGLCAREGGFLANFVVLDDHVHLIYQPQGPGGLPLAMKWLFGTYAARYNHLVGIGGRLWGSRYDSRPLVDPLEVAGAMAGIDGHAVRSGLAERPEDWPWGGLWQRLFRPRAFLGSSAEEDWTWPGLGAADLAYPGTMPRR